MPIEKESENNASTLTFYKILKKGKCAGAYFFCVCVCVPIYLRCLPSIILDTHTGVGYIRHDMPI